MNGKTAKKSYCNKESYCNKKSYCNCAFYILIDGASRKALQFIIPVKPIYKKTFVLIKKYSF
jgi:hypothetical protein